MLLDYSNYDIGASTDESSFGDDLDSDGLFVIANPQGNIVGIGVDFQDVHVLDILEVLGLRATGGLIVSDHAAEVFGAHSYGLVSVVSYPDLGPSPGAINRPSIATSFLRGGITLSPEPLSEPIAGPFWLFRTSVPEPSSIALLVLGSGGLLIRYRD